jgi:hypothetical protein
VVKRKIFSPRRESNPRTPIIQSVALRHTTELREMRNDKNNLVGKPEGKRQLGRPNA